MNVGDYVRTITGKIYKLTENDLKFEITKQNCKISSPNIIDLIEDGDYVNGHRVSNVFDEYITTEDDQITIDKENIKSILTKEQFESMKYEVN